MNRRHVLLFSAALLGLSGGALVPVMSFAKDGGSGGGEGSGDGDSSGSGGGDDGGSSGPGSGDDGGNSGHGSSGRGGSDDSGRSGRRGDDTSTSTGNGRNRDTGDSRPQGPTAVDTVALAYGDGSRESVVAGSYSFIDRDGHVAEQRVATRSDLARLSRTRLGGGRNGEVLVRMDSRSGAVEIIDRRGWREVMNAGRYALTDPTGSLVRSRAIRPDDLVRVKALLTR